MATFKVGQRVKRVLFGEYPHGLGDVPMGSVGTVAFEEGHNTCYAGCAGVLFDGIKSGCVLSDAFSIPTWQLVPAIDPRADQFIASLERLGREPLVPVVDPLRQVKAYIDIARGGR